MYGYHEINLTLPCLGDSYWPERNTPFGAVLQCANCAERDTCPELAKRVDYHELRGQVHRTHKIGA